MVTRCGFKNISDAEKAKFQESSCLLRISVGQGSHENERFKATIDLIKNTFSSCKIALHDTLQRHTMAILKSNETADGLREKALYLGDCWLDRNRSYCETMGDRLTVIRWDKWLNSAEYANWKNIIVAELESNESYREAFHQSVEEYLTRLYRRFDKRELFDRSRAEKLCMDYLIEECAAMCMWPETGCQFEVYAGTDNMAMVATRERFIRPEHPGLLHVIAINFNRRPDLAPQQFDLTEGKC